MKALHIVVLAYVCALAVGTLLEYGSLRMVFDIAAALAAPVAAVVRELSSVAALVAGAIDAALFATVTSRAEHVAGFCPVGIKCDSTPIHVHRTPVVGNWVRLVVATVGLIPILCAWLYDNSQAKAERSAPPYQHEGAIAGRSAQKLPEGHRAFTHQAALWYWPTVGEPRCLGTVGALRSGTVLVTSSHAIPAWAENSLALRARGKTCSLSGVTLTRAAHPDLAVLHGPGVKDAVSRLGMSVLLPLNSRAASSLARVYGFNTKGEPRYSGAGMVLNKKEHNCPTENGFSGAFVVTPNCARYFGVHYAAAGEANCYIGACYVEGLVDAISSPALEGAYVQNYHGKITYRRGEDGLFAPVDVAGEFNDLEVVGVSDVDEDGDWGAPAHVVVRDREGKTHRMVLESSNPDHEPVFRLPALAGRGWVEPSKSLSVTPRSSECGDALTAVGPHTEAASGASRKKRRSQKNTVN